MGYQRGALYNTDLGALYNTDLGALYNTDLGALCGVIKYCPYAGFKNIPNFSMFNLYIDVPTAGLCLYYDVKNPSNYKNSRA